jgi:hypothetical protein
MISYEEIALSEKNVRSEMQCPGYSSIVKYLSARGITEDLYDRLALHILPARQLVNLVRRTNTSTDERLAVVFPHHDMQGHRIPWWSARLVDTDIRPSVRSFAEQIDRSSRGKMFCPPKELIHGYLSPLCDWTRLTKGQRVYIHESAIKAINGSILGYHSVGLNGVRGFSGNKYGVSLIDELRGLPWKELSLQPVICFDSNATDNWDVQKAIGDLAKTLYTFEAPQAIHLLLPKSPEGTDWGFDDFRTTLGDDAAREYLESAGVQAPIDDMEVLKLKLNAEVCVVRSLKRIAEQSTGILMSQSEFVGVNYAHLTVLQDVGPDKPKKRIPVAREWLMDSRRATVQSLAYLPGREKIHDDVLNLWRDMGQKQAGGDVTPWTSLLENCVAETSLRAWIIQWFAYPLQQLGGKLNTFLHIFGPPGSGKNALLAPLMSIYGRNAVSIGREHIASNFNSILSSRQFVNLDEIHGGNDRDAVAITNKIKILVTSPVIVVNQKNQPEYEIKNCINIVTTSNYIDSIRLDDEDRRACVIRFQPRESRKGDQEYWEAYFRWVENGGAAALYDWLLKVDMTGFDPMGWAPMTPDKLLVTESTRRHDEQWAKALVDDPDGMLPPHMIGWCFATTEQLSSVCWAGDSTGSNPGRSIALGKRLHEAGLNKIEIKYNGKKTRLWNIRDRREWPNAEILAYLRRNTVIVG